MEKFIYGFVQTMLYHEPVWLKIVTDGKYFVEVYKFNSTHICRTVYGIKHKSIYGLMETRLSCGPVWL
jgi:hypothetical protein